MTRYKLRGKLGAGFMAFFSRFLMAYVLSINVRMHVCINKRKHISAHFCHDQCSLSHLSDVLKHNFELS